MQTFYTARLSQHLIKQGPVYVANDSAAIKISPNFVAFFNRAKRLSDSLYANNSPTPHVEYSMKQIASTVDGLALKIGNDSLVGNNVQKNYIWTGAAENILATVKDSPEESTSGPWSLFHFITDSHQTNKGSGIYDLEFVKQVNGRELIVNGKRQSYTYELHFLTGNPWAEFSGLSCVSQVAR
jgi:type VI protein secretion system component VasK